MFKPIALLLPLALAALPAHAADAPSLLSRPDAFFTSDEGRRDLDNLLSWQGHGPAGIMGWPKAYDVTRPRPADGGGIEWEGIATIDNGATYSELELLARAISLEPATGERHDILLPAFNAGFDALLSAQYPNGGWPQRFPADALRQSNYGKHITFNDNAMARVLLLMDNASKGAKPYAFVDDARRQKANTAFDKGIDCILNCQVTLDGKLTGWCAQHDESTLKPVGARAYELPSLSGSEGADLVILLMKLDNPSPRVKQSIEAAAAWFDAAKITGKRVQNTTTPEGRDRIVVDDPASVLWARFYDLDSPYPGKPFFCGRDGIKKWNMADIERERRAGYAWYGNWGEKVAREFAAWKKRNP